MLTGRCTRARPLFSFIKTAVDGSRLLLLQLHPPCLPSLSSQIFLIDLQSSPSFGVEGSGAVRGEVQKLRKPIIFSRICAINAICGRSFNSFPRSAVNRGNLCPRAMKMCRGISVIVKRSRFTRAKRRKEKGEVPGAGTRRADFSIVDPGTVMIRDRPRPEKEAAAY